MGRMRLKSMESQCTDSTIGNLNNAKKIFFLRRLTFTCGILISLTLLYLPIYHYAQLSFSRSGETKSTEKGSQSFMHLGASLDQLKGWSYNKSRDLSTYILPQYNTTIISPYDICSNSSFLLIIICSAVNNYNVRMAIRSTWGNKYNLDTLYNSTIKVAFLVGQSNNETKNNLIFEESVLHGDIIQEKFDDTYNNLTLKSSMLLKWVTTNCNDLKFLMKSDDDMFVNIPKLIEALQALKRNNNVLIGSLICDAEPISDPKNKWYIPKYMYSDRKYPNYLSGTGYAMSLDVANKLYKACLTISLLHLEDVFITGLCSKKAGIQPIDHPGFTYLSQKLDFCTLKSIITAHKINVPNMYLIWKILQNSVNVTCEKSK